MKPFKVAVMYGSQTGNAQSIAEGIHDGCQKKGVESTLLKCDAWKKMNPELKEWSALVLVVSTTGNGDAPENSERFWRFMKRRTQPKDLLEGLAFSVLGLGDTNYDKFCYMGKSFDKRLRELGAVPFLPPAFADEATNMEETIEPWLASLYASLETLRDGGNGGDGGGVPQGAAAPAVVAVTPTEVSPQQQQERREERVEGREVGQQTVAAAAAAAALGGQESAAKTEEEASGAEDRTAAAAATAAQEKAAAAVQEKAAAAAQEKAAAAAAAAQEKAAAAAAAQEKEAAAAAAAVREKAAQEKAAQEKAAAAAAAAAVEKTKAVAATSTVVIAESRSAPSLTPQENGSDHLRPASSAGSNGTVTGDTRPASQRQLSSAPSGPANGIVGDGGGPKAGFGDGAAASPSTSESVPPHRIAVMYGSQTGNAQSIAEGIHDSCKKKGLVSTLLACDGWKKMSPELKEWSALVLVVSTTGNGDAPENTERFWRFLKRRSQPKDLLGGLAFTVLGLGDTNYDKFCHMGKSFDKRLRELGAVPFHSPAFADEATNMEETIEPWLAALYPALRASLQAAGTAIAVGVAGEGVKTPRAETTPDSTAASTPAAAAAAAAGAAGTVSDAAAPAAEGAAATKEMEAAGATVAGAEDVTEAIRGAAAAAFQESPEQPAVAAAATAVANGRRPTTSTAGTVSPTSAAAAAEAAPPATASSAAAGAAAGAAKALAELTLSDTATVTPPSPCPPSSSAVIQPGQAPAPTDQTSVSGSSSAETMPSRAVPADDDDQLPWSPSGDSGARPLSDFLSPEHLEPGYAPAKSELPKSRPSASSVHFHTPASSAGGGAGGEGDGQQQQQPWLQRARQRSSSMESRHTMDWPFAARVRSARYLTEGGRQAERRVIHMELSLKGSGITYEPGDVIGLRCPNPPADTAYVLERLQSVLPEGAGPDVSFQHSLRSLPNPCTLRDALSHRLDLQAPLRRPVLRALSECCQDAAERAWMELLCAKISGAAVYAAYVSAQSLTLCELLEAFPSCRPTPGVLLALLPPLPPRLYSVASSQLATPDSVAVALSVVSFQLPHAPSPASSRAVGDTAAAAAGSAAPAPASAAAAEEGGEGGEGFVTRRGLCTNWLEGILAPFLEGEGATVVNGGGGGGRGGPRAKGREGTTVSVPVFLKPTKEFLLPASAKWPCVLIGPGTGVSPFVGFLKHREEQQIRRRETADAVCSGYWRGGYEISLEGEEDEATAYRGREGRGDMWLFFGCRNESQDWIFRHEMEDFLAKGTLAKLSTAFSRDASEKVYVQHRIKEHGAELTRLMLQEGAYVYVCGDGNAMAQGVHKALVEALAEHGDAGGVDGEKGAEAALKVMKQKNRYVLDVWS